VELFIQILKENDRMTEAMKELIAPELIDLRLIIENTRRELKNKNTEIENKNTEIKNKDAEIERLKQQLEKLKNQQKIDSTNGLS